MSEALELLWIPFLAAIVLTGIHTWFGIQVLSRNVIFVDLALAQISALGATLAFMLGHLPQSAASYGYSLLFTAVGAALLASSRRWSSKVTQEAFIGVIYVVATAAALIMVDKAPQGAEHLRQMLVGSILSVTLRDVLGLSLLYGAIALLHYLCRKSLLASAADAQRSRLSSPRTWAWDFVFYCSFGVVVASSVAIAGVLLVFSFLIIPAIIGTLYSSRTTLKLLIGWIAGVLASTLGLASSYVWDLPTGGAMVCTFGLVLIAAATMQPLTRRDTRRSFVVAAASTLRGLLLVLLMISALWLAAFPRGDQPLLDALETWQPSLRAAFLSDSDRDTARQAQSGAERVKQEAKRLAALERNRRWQGAELSDEDLRKIASYQQSFQEMQQGEQFVQRALRNKARERQRWVLGAPLFLICLGLLLWSRVRD